MEKFEFEKLNKEKPIKEPFPTFKEEQLLKVVEHTMKYLDISAKTKKEDKESFYNGARHFYWNSKKMKPMMKILLAVILDSTLQNKGWCHWAQGTLRDRTGISRATIISLMERLRRELILLPHPNNKVGGKNKYTVHIPNIIKLYSNDKM